MHVVLVGTSHHRAPVELRERLALNLRLAREVAARLAAKSGEAVALSTCNRTELYVAHADAETAAGLAYAELCRIGGRAGGLSQSELAPALLTRINQSAALHLFRVASGLDSMVPGEAQILGQVREAWEAAQEEGATGTVLNRLFHQALRTGKRVRSETAIAENPASVSSAAAELAHRVFGELEGRRILVLGSGKMGTLAAVNLASRGAVKLFVASRTFATAERLARRLGGEPIGFDLVEKELERADIVISSTGAPGFVISAEQATRAMRRRRGRPIFFVDIAVPRDVDPAVNELEGCYLYDIDDLAQVVAEGLADRRREAIRAEAIVSEEAEDFHRWRLSLEVVPAIASLRQRAEEIRAAELARAGHRLGRLSERERRTVESLTAQIVNKLLHLPTVRLKEAAASEGVLYADAVRHLFGLGEEKE